MRFVPGFAVIALTLALAVSLDIADTHDTHDTRTWADARAQILTDDDPRLRLSSADRAAYVAMWASHSLRGNGASARHP